MQKCSLGPIVYSVESMLHFSVNNGVCAVTQVVVKPIAISTRSSSSSRQRCGNVLQMNCIGRGKEHEQYLQYAIIFILFLFIRPSRYLDVPIVQYSLFCIKNKEYLTKVQENRKFFTYYIFRFSNIREKIKY